MNPNHLQETYELATRLLKEKGNEEGLTFDIGPYRMLGGWMEIYIGSVKESRRDQIARQLIIEEVEQEIADRNKAKPRVLFVPTHSLVTA